MMFLLCCFGIFLEYILKHPGTSVGQIHDTIKEQK